MYVSGHHGTGGFTLLTSHWRLQHKLTVRVLCANLHVQYIIVLQVGTQYIFISSCQLTASAALKNNSLRSSLVFHHCMIDLKVSRHSVLLQ